MLCSAQYLPLGPETSELGPLCSLRTLKLALSWVTCSKFRSKFSLEVAEAVGGAAELTADLQWEASKALEHWQSH